ncbi:hypothetical protein ASG77_02720 [Arthrobacter sp. Soil762]|nr:hypothetical protein ASG77_02720 [Arthrobacter sp. Soil762]
MPAKSYLSVNVVMIIGARTFQLPLASNTVSYWSMDANEEAMAGRASVLCSRTFRATAAS